MRVPLTVRLLIGLVAGLMLGLIISASNAPALRAIPNYVEPIGTLWANAIRMTVIPLRLETLFGGDKVYDYEPPRALATGLFDLSFVLVFVLPLAIGAAAAAVGAQERDQAILPFVASQPISPRQWWSTRVAALAVVLIPGVAAAVVVTLAAAGAPIVHAWSETLAALTLVAAHSLFWLAVAGWCLARGHGAVSTTSVIAALWLCLTMAVPLGGSFILQTLVRPPSPIVDVSELRRTTDAVQREADAVVARRLVAHLGPSVERVDPTTLDYSTRLVFITEEMEQRLEAQERRRQTYARTATTVATLVSWLAPGRAACRPVRSRGDRHTQASGVCSGCPRVPARAAELHVSKSARASSVFNLGRLPSVPRTSNLHRLRSHPAVRAAGSASSDTRSSGAQHSTLVGFFGRCAYVSRNRQNHELEARIVEPATEAR